MHSAREQWSIGAACLEMVGRAEVGIEYLYKSNVLTFSKQNLIRGCSDACADTFT